MKIKYILPGIALAVVIAGIPGTINSEFDLNGLNQQVQNHEARINNLEKDTKVLQENTNTPPADDQVSVAENIPVSVSSNVDTPSSPVSSGDSQSANHDDQTVTVLEQRLITKSEYDVNTNMCYYEYTDGSNDTQPAADQPPFCKSVRQPG